MSRKIDSYMDQAVGCARSGRETRRSLMPSYRIRPTAVSLDGALPPELLMRPRIPRAPKLPAFSLYPLNRDSRRPEAPAPFVSEGADDISSWSAIVRELETAANQRSEPTPQAQEAELSDDAPRPSRLERARAYLADPHGAASALGIGAAAGLVVASLLLFACK